MGRAYDDLFPGRDESEIGRLKPFPEEAARAAKAKRSQDRRTPADAGGNRRVKRGRRQGAIRPGRRAADRTRRGFAGAVDTARAI